MTRVPICMLRLLSPYLLPEVATQTESQLGGEMATANIALDHADLLTDYPFIRVGRCDYVRDDGDDCRVHQACNYFIGLQVLEVVKASTQMYTSKDLKPDDEDHFLFAPCVDVAEARAFN